MDELITRFNTIIVNIGQGNIHALNELYEHYGGLLYTMARKYLFDKSFAEDVVSEVFCKIVKSSHKFNPKQNGLNWVFKIVKNTCIDWNKRYTNNCDDIYEYCDLASVFPNYEETETHSLIQKALSSLNDEENLIIYLKYWEGLTIREIAKKMKKPKSTIQYIYSQSIEKIAQYLDDEE